MYYARINLIAILSVMSLCDEFPQNIRAAEGRIPRRANASSTANAIAYPTKVQTPAQKVHLLVASFTSDPQQEVNLGSQANRDFIKSLYQRELENAPERQGTVSVIEGTNFTPETIGATLSAMSVGTSDTLICYISTHGAYDPSLGHFMSTAGADLFRSQLLLQLQQKKARLTVLITDSCAIGLPGAPVPFHAAAPTAVTHALFDLLFYYQGIVNVNSSSGPTAANPAGQTSWYWNQADAQGGGFFTRAFCNSAIYAPGGSNWQTFFADLTQRTADQAPPEPQTPMWFTN